MEIICLLRIQKYLKMQKLQNKPTVTSMIIGGRRRLAYAYPDGQQAIEEYDMKTHELLSRRTKKPAQFKETKWQYEIGEIEDKGNSQLLIKSSATPIFLRRDTLQCFQWRIRNLPYPPDVYLLEVDPEKQQVVIKTTIKKYYKRFDIIDLKKLNIKLAKENLSFTHANNTLIVSYKKPEILLQKELALRKQFEKMNSKKPKEGDIQCTTQ